MGQPNHYKTIQERRCRFCAKQDRIAFYGYIGWKCLQHDFEPNPDGVCDDFKVRADAKEPVQPTKGKKK